MRPCSASRFRRRPVGGDRDGDRGKRRAFDHGLDDIVMPAGAAANSGNSRAGQRDFGDFVLGFAAFAILAIMAMAYLYYRALAYPAGAIGLLSFAGDRPARAAVFGGPFWRRATRAAMAGMLAGIAVWDYSCFLPSFLEAIPPASCCCSMVRSASRRCARRPVRRRSARRCCTACSEPLRSIS